MFIKSEGFSEAKVTPAVVNNGKNIRVTFNIQPGPRDVVNSLHIDGAKTLTEAQFAPKGLQLLPANLIRKDWSRPTEIIFSPAILSWDI